MKEKQGALFIISGPSGVGKTTVVTEFLRQHGPTHGISRVITYTTKKPRHTETHGIDYHFITHDDFQSKIQDNFFLEWSGEYGACYGTPSYVAEHLNQGKSFMLVIDRLGALQIIKKYPDAVLIWIKVSSMELLSDRLKGRNSDDQEVIQRRLLLAEKEMAQESQRAVYHHHIINDDLKHALEGISGIVLGRLFALPNDR